MIDPQHETLISLAAATAMLPARRAGKRPHLSCLYRWSNPPGCKGIVLETCQVGGTRCTSVEALGRFIGGLTALSQGNQPAPPPLPRHRRRQIADAQRRLARAGL